VRKHLKQIPCGRGAVGSVEANLTMMIADLAVLSGAGAVSEAVKFTV